MIPHGSKGGAKDAFGRAGGSADIELVFKNVVHEKQPTTLKLEQLLASHHQTVDETDGNRVSQLELPIRGFRFLIDYIYYVWSLFWLCFFFVDIFVSPLKLTHSSLIL